MDILKKLGGRKFVTAVSFSLLIAANDSLGLGMAEETLQQMALVLGSWLAGESLIDASSALMNKEQPKK